MSSLFKWLRAAEKCGSSASFSSSLFPPFLHLPRQSCWEAAQHVGCCWLPRGLGALDSGLWQIAFEQLNLNHPDFCNCYSSPPYSSSLLSPAPSIRQTIYFYNMLLHESKLMDHPSLLFSILCGSLGFLLSPCLKHCLKWVKTNILIWLKPLFSADCSSSHTFPSILPPSC